MELSGLWRAHPANDDLRRVYQEARFDDRSWTPIEVPSHWRTQPAFADHDGPLLYRHTFATPSASDTASTATRPAGTGERRWLWLDGVFSQGDVWLDGVYVGDTDGYFFPHAFDVTETLGRRRDHVLAIEVSSPLGGDPTQKRSLVGAFGQREHMPPDWNPGGIWRPVRLVTTGAVAIRHSRLRCTEATAERAVLALRLVLDSTSAGPVVLRTRIGGREHELERTLAAGENRVEWTVAVASPERWWPRALGPAVLHDVVVDVLTDHDGPATVSDSRRWRCGLRSVEQSNWRWQINGEPLFLKGADIGPACLDLARAGRAELTRDLRAAADAGLDLVRVHTHISRPELYDAADELGMLVWQDLPLHRRYARGVRRQALRQTREAVDLLAHHPSLILWCAHNEPYLVDEGLPPAAAQQGYGRRAISRVLPQQLPSWNRTLLDGSLRVTLERNDGTRPVIAHSGVAPHLPRLDGTDSHLWFGWYEGDVDELGELAATVPRLVRFVSEFGAQAVPTTDEFLHPGDWPHLAWERVVADFGGQTAVFDQRVSPDDHATFADWRDATQQYQAYVVGRTIEILRRLKYRPTGGFCVYKMSDATPAVGFGLIDHAGVAKAAYATLAECCRPVLAVVDLPPRLTRSTTVRSDVHVVSDLRTDLTDATVTVELSADGGATPRSRWGWCGDLPADSCVKAGEITFVAPVAARRLELTLTVAHPDIETVVRRVHASVV